MTHIGRGQSTRQIATRSVQSFLHRDQVISRVGMSASCLVTMNTVHGCDWQTDMTMKNTLLNWSCAAKNEPACKQWEASRVDRSSRSIFRRVESIDRIDWSRVNRSSRSIFSRVESIRSTRSISRSSSCVCLYLWLCSYSLCLMCRWWWNFHTWWSRWTWWLTVICQPYKQSNPMRTNVFWSVQFFHFFLYFPPLLQS